MQRLTLAKRGWLWFMLGAAAIYFYGLGRPPFIGPDEPRYAEVAREMFVRADPVTPTLGGHTWFEKPALLYWMMMASFGAFGVSEWAARFGVACAGLLAALFIYWLGRRVERDGGREETRGLALSSCIAVASSAGMIGFSRGVNFDSILTLTMTIALCCFFVAELEVDEKRRRWLLAGFYVAAGASLLAKGLVGIVLLSGIVATYFLMRREWPNRTLKLSLLWGVPLALLVAAVWYVPVTVRHGWPFVDEFFIQHHFERFTSNKYHHPQRFYFYLPIMALLAFPWTAFMASALAAAPRWKWRAPSVEVRLRVFALAWLVVPVIFFSLSKSKLPGYVLPALPGAALLVGFQLARFLRGAAGKRAMRFTGALMLLLAAAVVVYTSRTSFISMHSAFVIAAPLAVAGALVPGLAHMRRLCVVLTICATFAATALAVNCATDRIAERESVRHLLQQADARGYATAPVFHMFTVDYTTTFYAADRLAYGADGEPVRYDGAFLVAEAAEQHRGPILVFILSEYASQLTDYKRIETEVIGDNGVVALIAVRPR